ncbi:DNA repair protein RecO [Pullulanibacillus sp. KACC 23026]|uniref:DNA repair protein RecO n=1 Tax=Pullulanibacillus sp. KACC 23026 TaxID=3028315 RepID=UPI0023AFBFDC|nr:DNA repair protein RecO [Pullulanibacillus sp. KACC 23026]WEG14242.1 DNA repair protein RecO [Pullulanibacillus sp. KACC 23026]
MNSDEALVIRSTNYGETNKIITLLTKEKGKIGVMARGAKRPKSPLHSGSQLLTHGLYLYQKSRGLGTLYQADSIEGFRYIKSDLVAMAHAAYIIEMVDKLVEENQPSPSLFSFILKLLELLEDKRPPQVLRLIFDLRMLGLAGIQPELSSCAACGGRSGPYSFSFSTGGLLCTECRNQDPTAVPLPDPVTRLFYLFQKIDPNKIGDISLKPETVQLMSAILDQYFDQYSGLRLKSKQFLKQLDKLD